jgi:multicomponent Na+:H+ antiporter subunit G
MTAQELLGHTLTIIGTGLVALSALGLVRLPDVYNRVNAVSKAAALGVCCVLLGVLVLLPGPVTAVFLALSIALQMLTAPFGAYAVGRAAYRSGAPFTGTTHRNDLRDSER